AVVAGDVGERPRVAAVGPGGGVRGPGQVQAGQRLAADPGARARGGVRFAVVGDGVGGEGAAGVGLADGVGDRGAHGRVVAGRVAEAPRVGVAAGIGVRRPGQVQVAGQVHTTDPGARARGGVRVGVVGDVVGGHGAGG